MSRLLTLFLVLMGTLLYQPSFWQAVTDGSYRTVAHIKSDGTIQDASYRTIGHIRSDGTVQDESYRTIGHAKDIPRKWAAFYFFFHE